MTDVFIISEENLRQFTDINNNVDSKLLKNAVREAQDIEIQRILGTKLYDKILDDIIYKRSYQQNHPNKKTSSFTHRFHKAPSLTNNV